jgi:hypothetical protein
LQAAGMDWIIHIDTDELLSPEGTEDFSLTRLLEEVAPDIDLVVFPNYETIIERVDIEDPFAEVRMLCFRPISHFWTSEGEPLIDRERERR